MLGVRPTISRKVVNGDIWTYLNYTGNIITIVF